jgi:hypothetical protein
MDFHALLLFSFILFNIRVHWSRYFAIYVLSSDLIILFVVKQLLSGLIVLESDEAEPPVLLCEPILHYYCFLYVSKLSEKISEFIHCYV